MRLIRGAHNLAQMAPVTGGAAGCALTIGNFDGVHLGHRAVLARLNQRARDLGLASVVMLFEPQPAEWFRPGEAPPRLMRLREKIAALASTGVDITLCLHFNAALAGLSAEDFIRRYLVEGLAVRYLLIGDDFRFGRDRRGDFALLLDAGQDHGFEVERMGSVVTEGERVSSTRIRGHLGAGELDQAARLLGAPYAMYGRVAHGDKRGRTLGFPTANITLRRRRVPLTGVYVVELVDGLGEAHYGIANLGTRPTVDGVRTLLEVHLLDYSGDLYGQQVRVEFLDKIRDERRFTGLDELRAQIAQDRRAAYEVLADAGRRERIM